MLGSKSEEAAYYEYPPLALTCGCSGVARSWTCEAWIAPFLRQPCRDMSTEADDGR